MNSKLTCLPKSMIDADLQILLCYVLQKPRSFLLTHPDYVLSTQEQHDFNELKTRYEQGEPLAYLLGSQCFWKHEFKVSPAVLIPRPDTELLLELALDQAPQGARVLELGTGSGCVAVSFALERPDAQVTAIDLSPVALEIAKENARVLGASVHFMQSNWFEQLAGQRFDLILSNPPYIEEGDAHLSALSFEPQLALVSGKSGLNALEWIVKTARNFLHPAGILAVEHGYNQRASVQALFEAAGYQTVETRQDLQGHPRVTWGRL